MFSRFFIDRPIFASVLSIVITLGGLVAVFQLPVAQYPQITPPSIVVQCTYPGASARDVAESIAAPIEQQVNGVENMIYMSSQSANDGTYTLSVTFKPGVNLDFAQVLVQNRVNLAMPQLPDVVKQAGVTTRKRNPDILLVVSIYSPHGTYNQFDLSNFATIQVADELRRVDGAGDVFLFGQQDYSMRIWVDPDRLAARNLMAGDVVNAVREQNFQIAAGRFGQPPVHQGAPFEYTIKTHGRLTEPDEFADIILRTNPDGTRIRIKDVGRVVPEPRNQDITSKIDGHPCTSLACFQLPYANALDTRDRFKDKMEELKKSFPDDIDYAIAFDTTPFVRESIQEVFRTLAEAVILVAIVVLIFLQNWRSTLIPLTAVPVAIIGTFGAMAAIGFSLNTLTLFGLVLAIGIVVDDAIVVVEAVERQIENGLAPRDAAYKAMQQVSGPVVAVALVLSAVFVPCAFITGITGQFFRQFALTIAVSTIISAFNSLTLSPALAALLLQPREARKDVPGRLLDRGLGWFFRLFNWGFRRTTTIYSRLVGLALRGAVVVLVVYGGLMVLTAWGFNHLPTGYIPNQDQGRLYISVQMPDAAALEQTQEVCDIVARQAHKTRGCAHTITVVGQSWILSANGSYFGALFMPLKEFAERRDPELTSTAINATLDHRLKSLVHLAGRFTLSPVAAAELQTAGVPGAVLQRLNVLQGGEFEIRDLFKALAINELASWQDLMVNKAQLGGQSFETLRAAGVPEAVLAKLIALMWEEDEGTRVEFLGTQGDFRKALTGILDRDELDRYQDLVLKSLPHYDLNANVSIFGPPPVSGLGSTGGFKLIVEDRSGEGDLVNLQNQTARLIAAGQIDPNKPPLPADAPQRKLGGMLTVFRADTPQQFVDIHREQCQSRSVNPNDVFTSLQVYLGSLYVNDFNRFGRTWQVVVQADGEFRNDPDKVKRQMVRNRNGGMVPLGDVLEVQPSAGPILIQRYNMYPAAAVVGNTAKDASSGDGIDAIEQISAETLPESMACEWTEINYIQIDAAKNVGNNLIFPLAVVFVFLVLAAQYESWALPLAVILVVPMCILGSLAGVWLSSSDINIFTQIGFVVLVGLASKNAILIVEYAKHQRESGLSRRDATLEACQLRLRPILMTSFAFILGVLPLMLANGAGAEMRRSLGTAVFSGMLAVTLFGIFLTPVFFFVIEWFMDTPLWSSPPLRRLRFMLAHPNAKMAYHAAGVLAFSGVIWLLTSRWLVEAPLFDHERKLLFGHVVLNAIGLLVLSCVFWTLIVLVGRVTRRPGEVLPSVHKQQPVTRNGAVAHHGGARQTESVALLPSPPAAGEEG